MSDCMVRADGAVTRVRVDAELDAAGIEALVDELMACRQAMTPRRFPTMFPGAPIALFEGAHVQTQADGRLLLSVMTPVGWAGAPIEREALEAVMRASSAARSDRPSGSRSHSGRPGTAPGGR